MSKKPAKTDEFESALEQVEEIVEQIEGGQIPLSEVVKKFKVATERIRDCRAMLSEIEQQIKIIDDAEEAEEDGRG